ncbi:Probable lipoprotein precursor [Flavobacterium indicum GPTSA100-9 = DSM 17447]|uniref:Probable lipoprotein n=1 Tax=Flavobacterium indicum (strain DSM 17447 / CIP 109464 / GPTSA100-9) TaxID=1094466 RepID=H8XVG3_FLAIG|nr:hypothetical protein [Flavobacterium indicum]CCG53927.1 Probable lipoprotein precursor [Flavobacterium indicum GPTSA100-9 = DSM 17447]
MKKASVLFFVLISLTSCDYILKSSSSDHDDMVQIDSLRKNQIIDDKNEHGCEVKSGYKWSNLEKKCVRVFEEGYRLSSVAKDSLGNSNNAYFFIAEDSLRAEVFLPDSKESIVLTREDESENFKFKDFELKQKGGFALLYDDTVIFKPALARDLKVIESDEPEMKGEPEGMKKDSTK